tara:strand:+ start:383 stop:1633 length:1251 start_codon:yes stop_codon:yes gene_type:complete
MALTYNLIADNTTNGTLGAINVNTGLVTFVPDANFSGTAGHFTYQVDNGYFLSNIAQVNVNVSPVNDPPNITSNAPTQTYFAGDAYSYTPITATDPDHTVSELTWSSTNIPAWLTLTQTNGVASISGTVPSGTTSFDLVVTDPLGLTDTQSITVGGIIPSVNSYFKFWFDSSGSITSTLPRLQRDLKGTGVTNPYTDTTCLQYYLQDFYATGLYESQGNTDSATNGVDDYTAKVSLVSEADENPFLQLNNRGNSSTAGFSTVDPGGNFPSASSVVIGVFMDEASKIGISSSATNTWASTATTSSPITTAGMTALSNLKSQVTSLNATNSGFYRGLMYCIKVNGQIGAESNLLSAYDSAVTDDTNTQFGANGLSSISSYITPAGASNIDDGNTTDGYYTEKVVSSLQGLGYSIPNYV